MLKVIDLGHLRYLIATGHNQYVMYHGAGLPTERLDIDLNSQDQFVVVSMLDDTKQVLTDEDMMDRSYTNIGHAMALGSLMCEM